MALTNGQVPASRSSRSSPTASRRSSTTSRRASGDRSTLELDRRAPTAGSQAPAPIDPFALPAKRRRRARRRRRHGRREPAPSTRARSRARRRAAMRTATTCRSIKTRDALDALDNVLDRERRRRDRAFLLDSAKAKLWRHAYVEPDVARAQATAFQGDIYSQHRARSVPRRVRRGRGAPAPGGYSFRPAGAGTPIVPPNLMQRRVAVCVRDERRFGNWSGMGAGKTLSAILATRVVDAGLTVICCPNAVVDNWAGEIAGAFPSCRGRRRRPGSRRGETRWATRRATS